jgi:hypothetical protein
VGVRNFRTPILMSRWYENREKEFLRLREVAEIFVGIYIAFIEGVAGKLLHLHFARRLSATNLASLGAKQLIVRHL